MRLELLFIKHFHSSHIYYALYLGEAYKWLSILMIQDPIDLATLKNTSSSLVYLAGLYCIVCNCCSCLVHFLLKLLYVPSRQLFLVSLKWM